MNGIALFFTLVTSALMWIVPRRWAPLPLLLATAYISVNQLLEVGPFHFPLVRVLILVGFVRVMAKKEHLAGGWNTLDRLMVIWAACAVVSVFFHKSTVIIFRLGEVYNAVGTYFLCRIFIQGMDDIRHLFKIVSVILLPLAGIMLVERFKGVNPLGWIDFAPELPELRNGYFRAQGPFSHAILAGTAGAVCMPMALYLWRLDRKVALIGLAATGCMVYTSGSSGPIMATFSALGALAMWSMRGYLKAIRWLVVVMIIALDFVMNDPVYFIMARIDIAGGSTGYFRAQLIRSAIEHLSEWWFIGTDFTRHWMPSGIAANPDHTDMTNYYLQMGVWGGLPLMLAFMGILTWVFVLLGKLLRENEEAPVEDRFLLWTLGSILFSHVTTFWSISYFDQTVVLLYLLLGSVGCLHNWQAVPEEVAQDGETWSTVDQTSGSYQPVSRLCGQN